jgi:hypothetical protein
MSSDRTEGQSLKNRADALRGLATSGVLVEARAESRNLVRAGTSPPTQVSTERLGQLTPGVTPRAQAAEQPGSTARGLELQKPGTQVELPAAGFGPGTEKPVQQQTSVAEQKEKPPQAAADPKLAKGQSELDQIKRDIQARKQEAQQTTGPAPGARAPKRDEGRQR